ncbi:MAG TPA: STAS domain-containing protein [Solirubrobacteraceae bacterium]|jgi:anti-anti-sigma factor|nr:STAS domain-containing protein [Solirubrobacteraceae bacterium]
MAVHELDVTVRDRGGVVILDLVGDVDSSGEAALQRAYEEATLQDGQIALNFSRTDYINSTGIALIVGLLAQARARGVQITAFGLSDHYREIFEITRLADFMTIADNENGAVEGAERSNHA